jgi:type I restriction enzyme S subunit
VGKWETVRLGDAATFINGFAFKPMDWTDNGLPIIRIQNLTGSSDVVNYYNKPCGKQYEVVNGDILISWSASLGVYEWKQGKALLNQHIFKVLFDKLNFDKKFFVYVIEQKLSEMSAATHGSTMKHITKKHFDEIQIPFPPLKVQQQIADVLDRASALIEKRKAQLAKLDLLIKSQFIEMFGGALAHEEVELKNICSIITDGTHQPPRFYDIGIPFLFVSNIVDNEISYQTNKYITRDDYNTLIKRTPIEIGDILLTTVGSYGNPAIVRSEKEFCFQRHIAYLKPNRECVDSVYLHSAFLSDQIKRQIESKVKGIAQKTLNLSELKTINVQIPPLHLQKQFATFAYQVKTQKSKLQQSLAKMEQNYKSLMQKCFRGEIF